MAFELVGEDSPPVDRSHGPSPDFCASKPSESAWEAHDNNSPEEVNISTASPCDGSSPRRGAAGHSRRRDAVTADSYPNLNKKTAKTMGGILRARRLQLGLTQREFAAELGVKVAHVAYLELDKRRPSLSLLSRIAELLNLDRERLILLSRPEARSFLGTRRAEPIRAKDQAWREFKRNKGLQARNNIKKPEMQILSRVALLGRVSTPRSFLFILNSIRQAVEENE
jgi:transcriptional regulator with XRE-family HTH domain